MICLFHQSSVALRYHLDIAGKQYFEVSSGLVVN